MGDGARPPVIEPGSEAKFLAGWVTAALEGMREAWPAYGFGVSAGDDKFTAWRLDGTGHVMAEAEPADLRRLVAEDDHLLTGWMTETLDSMRRDFAAYGFGMGISARFTAWRLDGTGRAMAENDPSDLRRRVAEDDHARRNPPQPQRWGMQ